MIIGGREKSQESFGTLVLIPQVMVYQVHILHLILKVSLIVFNVLHVSMELIYRIHLHLSDRWF